MKEEGTCRKRKRKRQRNPKTPKEEPNEIPTNQNNDKKSLRETKIHKNHQHGGSSASSKRPKPSNFLDMVLSLSLSLSLSITFIYRLMMEVTEILNHYTKKSQLRERLSGGQFRMLNEKLYTCS